MTLDKKKEDYEMLKFSDMARIYSKILSVMRSRGVSVSIILKSHDPSQRANGFLTLAGGVVITFAKEILNLITGG